MGGADPLEGARPRPPGCLLGPLIKVCQAVEQGAVLDPAVAAAEGVQLLPQAGKLCVCQQPPGRLLQDWLLNLCHLEANRATSWIGIKASRPDLGLARVSAQPRCEASIKHCRLPRRVRSSSGRLLALAKSAVWTGCGLGRSALSMRPSSTRPSKSMSSTLPHMASSPLYGDQKPLSGGTSGSTCQAFTAAARP